MKDRPLRVLLIGPRPERLEGASIGGTTVLFTVLADLLSARHDVDVTVIGTTGVRGGRVAGLFRLLSILGSIVCCTPRADVVTLHVVRGGLFTLAPAVSIIASLFRKPFVLRKFGGRDYSDRPGLLRALIHWSVKRADLYLVETRALVSGAREDGVLHVQWYPNNRRMPGPSDEAAVPEGSCRRFVYLGQIHSGKGIHELIEAAGALPDSLPIDVYGTFGFDVPEDAFDGRHGITYRGVAPPGTVHDVLSSYDVLVLPSHHAGEGYPGVVLEAYGAGLPVICTRWRALPELVDDTTGILVEPRDAEALRQAMERLAADDALLRRLRCGVRERRMDYDAVLWAETFVEKCREVAAGASLSGGSGRP